VWDTHRDLVACFTWKQVGLGLPTLASRQEEARQLVVHVAPSQRLRQVQAEDGRVDAMGYIRSFYHRITVFYILGPRNEVVF
jgi:hypothetical protein